MKRQRAPRTEAAPRGGAADPLATTHAPTLAGNEERYLRECVRTGWVSSAGPFVERFERAFAEYVGAKHAVATVNGTASLHVALRVAGVRPGDEVLVPDLTFIAPVNAVRYCGAHPALMDADPATWQLDAGKVEGFLREECALRSGRCVDRRTGRTVRAVVPVHLLGLACEIDRFLELARRWRLAVVEDAAEGVGVRYRGRHVGTHGRLGAFSFNGNKIITAGGGGMLVAADRATAEYARYLTTQAKNAADEYYHREVGYNYRISNVQAAIGLAQLEQVDGFLRAKRANAAAYRRELAALPELTPMPEPPNVEASFWLYTVLLPPRATLARRKAVLAALARRGIGARGLWNPMHGLPPNRGCRAWRLEHSQALFRRGISLPSSATVRGADVRRCIQALKAALRG